MYGAEQQPEVDTYACGCCAATVDAATKGRLWSTALKLWLCGRCWDGVMTARRDTPIAPIETFMSRAGAAMDGWVAARRAELRGAA